MGERLLCKQEVIGSIPFTSTTLRPCIEKEGYGRQATRVMAIKVTGHRINRGFAEPPLMVEGMCGPAGSLTL